MATERQVAANRRNARNSTGPRSDAGKKRASRSSYRHGLRATIVPGVEHAKGIERLARKIVGATTDVAILEDARAAAQAEFDIAQVRQVRVTVIEHMRTIGECAAPLTSLAASQARVPRAPAAAGATMPSTEQERSHEAVRQALPELLKLDCYERRAVARRERSMQIITDRKNT
jgi:hypothetical protein